MRRIFELMATLGVLQPGLERMGFCKTKDGVEIFYGDWDQGQPIVFSHGWPLSADDWDRQSRSRMER